VNQQCQPFESNPYPIIRFKTKSGKAGQTKVLEPALLAKRRHREQNNKR
jgi:hypothetical protein